MALFDQAFGNLDPAALQRLREALMALRGPGDPAVLGPSYRPGSMTGNRFLPGPGLQDLLAGRVAGFGWNPGPGPQDLPGVLPGPVPMPLPVATRLPAGTPVPDATAGPLPPGPTGWMPRNQAILQTAVQRGYNPNAAPGQAMMPWNKQGLSQFIYDRGFGVRPEVGVHGRPAEYINAFAERQGIGGGNRFVPWSGDVPTFRPRGGMGGFAKK